MPSPIHPELVKWKYFYLGDDGAVASTLDEETIPEGLNKVAPISTSIFFTAQDRNITPVRMKNIVTAALNPASDGAEKPRICIALPYNEAHKAGYELSKPELAESMDYTDIVMYNHDLFFPHEGGATALLSAQDGAAQIASAIEKGFHIHSMAGGVFIGQKIELVRDYFREHPLPADRAKSVFAGFSDASEAQFGLSELTNYVHTVGAGATYAPPLGQKPIDATSRQEVISIFEATEDCEVTRKLSADAATFAAMRARYNDGEEVRCLTFFPRQLISATDSPYRPTFPEKLMLGLEGYAQSERGYNVHEALFVALSKGVINPSQVVAVVVENIIAKEEEMVIRRVNGKIPDYEHLEDSEREKIFSILAQSPDKALVAKLATLDQTEKEEQIKNYIARSNQAYENEAARVQEVAAMFGIPVVFGGVTRAGHARDFVVQPDKVKSLEFDGDGAITQTSVVKRDCKVQAIPCKTHPAEITRTPWPDREFGLPLSEEDSVVYLNPDLTPKKVATGYEYAKNPTLSPESPAINEALSQMKLLPANESARRFLEGAAKLSDSGEAKVIAGNSLNIAEMPLDKVAGKGLFCIMPHRVMGKGVHQTFDAIKMLNSGKMGASAIAPEGLAPDVPFVIFSAENPDRSNKLLSSLTENFDLKTPVFFTATSLTPEQMSSLPSLFEASVRVCEMAKTSGSLEKAAAVGFASAATLGKA